MSFPCPSPHPPFYLNDSHFLLDGILSPLLSCAAHFPQQGSMQPSFSVFSLLLPLCDFQLVAAPDIISCLSSLPALSFLSFAYGRVTPTAPQVQQCHHLSQLSPAGSTPLGKINHPLTCVPASSVVSWSFCPSTLWVQGLQCDLPCLCVSEI